MVLRSLLNIFLCALYAAISDSVHNASIVFLYNFLFFHDTVFKPLVIHGSMNCLFPDMQFVLIGASVSIIDSISLVNHSKFTFTSSQFNMPFQSVFLNFLWICAILQLFNLQLVYSRGDLSDTLVCLSNAIMGRWSEISSSNMVESNVCCKFLLM